MSGVVPIVLFAYARPEHLSRTLESLSANHVPLIYAFSDGPRGADKGPLVSQVREILRSIDWCEVRLVERAENLGLGRSILAGATEVFEKHEQAIVFEDDLVCVPGTYRYLSAAMAAYRENPEVMSVTGWTHPRVIPTDVTDQPYFDGRAESLVWGTWSRVWRGMDRDARTLMKDCEAAGIDVYRYGADLPEMARTERRRNIWAVRFLYLHLLHGGLCLRPPHSMVEHIGFDATATNSSDGSIWANPPLRPCPPVPGNWPIPVENAQCHLLWQKAMGARPSRLRRAARLGRGAIRSLAHRLTRHRVEYHQ